MQANHSVFMAIACLFAVGCTESTEVGTPPRTSEVAFTGHVGDMVTRMENNQWNVGDRVGIKVGETAKLYEVTDNGGNMSPQNPDDAFCWNHQEYTVQAWYPVTEENISLTQQTDEHKFYQCDLLGSETTISSDQAVLVFTHRMTRMQWELQGCNGYTDEEKKEARVTFTGYGSVSYRNGDLQPVGAADQTIQTCRNEYNTIGEALMMPCDMWGKPLIKVTIGGDTHTYTPDLNNPDDAGKGKGVLRQGAVQKYFLYLSKKGLEVDMTSSDMDWNNERIDHSLITDASFKISVADAVTGLDNYRIEGTDNGFIQGNSFTISFKEQGAGGLSYEGKCRMTRTIDNDMHTYTFSDIASDLAISYLEEYVLVGDYYYSDGTWGSEAVKEGCTTLGRIFKVDRHDTDHYNYSLDKVHGYVVCTAPEVGEISAPWLTAADGTYKDKLDQLEGVSDADRQNRDSYLGCPLTEALNKALTGSSAKEFPFWNAFRSLNIGAPEKSSGWYIPSIAQLKDIKASGVYEGFTAQYWSSDVYPERNDEGVARIWAVDYNGSSGAEGNCWASDSRKMILVLTF